MKTYVCLCVLNEKCTVPFRNPCVCVCVPGIKRRKTRFHRALKAPFILHKPSAGRSACSETLDGNKTQWNAIVVHHVSIKLSSVARGRGLLKVKMKLLVQFVINRNGIHL